MLKIVIRQLDNIFKYILKNILNICGKISICQRICRYNYGYIVKQYFVCVLTERKQMCMKTWLDILTALIE